MDVINRERGSYDQRAVHVNFFYAAVVSRLSEFLHVAGFFVFLLFWSKKLDHYIGSEGRWDGRKTVRTDAGLGLLIFGILR